MKNLPASLLPARGSPTIAPDRGGYTVTMRESFGADAMLEALAAAAPASGAPRLHVGWGSFRNLDIVAARRSGCAILLDINEHQFAVWRAVRQAMRTATNAAGFIDAVVPLLPTRPPLRQFNPSTTEWLRMDVERPGSWLHARHPERFAHVRELFRDGRVVEFALDMRGTSHGGADLFGEFAARLRQARAAGAVVPDTLYVSNVPWMMAQPVGFFGESHEAFVAGGAHAALARTRENLGKLCPAFDIVVSAMRPAPTSIPSNLLWRSELHAPGDFLLAKLWDTLRLEQGFPPDASSA